MGKSKTRKWYEKFDDDYSEADRNKSKDRRKQKRIKNAIRSRDYYQTTNLDMDE